MSNNEINEVKGNTENNVLDVQAENAKRRQIAEAKQIVKIVDDGLELLTNGSPEVRVNWKDVSKAHAFTSFLRSFVDNMRAQMPQE